FSLRWPPPTSSTSRFRSRSSRTCFSGSTTMRNLLRRQFERHRLLLAGSALVLGGFQFLLAAIVASMDISAASRQLLIFAPPALRAMIEQSMIDSPAGMLAFGWNHPVTHAVLTLVAIMLASRVIAGEVE